MILTSIDVDVEQRILKISSSNKFKLGKVVDSSSIVKSVKNFFFWDLPDSSAKTNEYQIKPDYFIVSKKSLEFLVSRYVQNDGAVLRNEIFATEVFVSKEAFVAYLCDEKQENSYDAYLIIYSLLNKKVVYEERNRDSRGRTIKGYVMHDPQSEEFKIQMTIKKLKENIEFLDSRVDEKMLKIKEYDRKIVENLKLKNKDIAKIYIRDKKKEENDIMYLLNRRKIIEDNMENLIENHHNLSNTDVWKIVKSINEQRLLEIDDMKEAVMDQKVVQENNKELDNLFAEQNQEEDDEIMKELEKIELGMELEGSLKSNKSKKAIENEEKNPFGLLNNPFPTTIKKANKDDNPMMPLQNNNPFESFFFGELKQDQQKNMEKQNKDKNPFQFLEN